MIGRTVPWWAGPLARLEEQRNAATWTGTCTACAKGYHDDCQGTPRNPCDCAANGHK